MREPKRFPGYNMKSEIPLTNSGSSPGSPPSWPCPDESQRGGAKEASQSDARAAWIGDAISSCSNPSSLRMSKLFISKAQAAGTLQGKLLLAACVGSAVLLFWSKVTSKGERWYQKPCFMLQLANYKQCSFVLAHEQHPRIL